MDVTFKKQNRGPGTNFVQTHFRASPTMAKCVQAVKNAKTQKYYKS